MNLTEPLSVNSCIVLRRPRRTSCIRLTLTPRATWTNSLRSTERSHASWRCVDALDGGRSVDWQSNNPYFAQMGSEEYLAAHSEREEFARAAIDPDIRMPLPVEDEAEEQSANAAKDRQEDEQSDRVAAMS